MAEIASGPACPVGNGATVYLRVRNQGAGATTAGSVVKVEVTHYTGIQFYTARRYFRIGALAAGASTSLGVDLGDGSNAPATGNGSTTPVVSMSFRNAIPLGPGWSGYVTSWKVTVDTSYGPVYYGVAPTGYYVSYAPSVSESSEPNNVIQGTTSSCNY
ncbi:hypothetical protein WMF18_31740 [Sorangium sp. So ce315]|uniref:hypothetical protein n=1 Tax=Sorangium sp. So ce315 TaxID=3133299 RepID=UPI003F601F37